MNVNEIFGPTIQGEGKYTGYPSVFLRLNGCNLRCAFAGGSICDTPYTSHCPEKGMQMTPEEVADKIIELFNKTGQPHKCHLVITGGEPCLQLEEVSELVYIFEDKGYHPVITIETNGTIPPNYDLAERVFWSISPKLETSCCFEGTDVPKALQEAHKKNRINLKALDELTRYNYQLKFVYSGPDSVAEIKDILNRLVEHKAGQYIFIMPEDLNVLLMPEGINVEQLDRHAEECVQACIENGWIFCDRLHIRIWGEKRAV